jgi:hypothetical protein
MLWLLCNMTVLLLRVEIQATKPNIPHPMKPTTALTLYRGSTCQWVTRAGSFYPHLLQHVFTTLRPILLMIYLNPLLRLVERPES